MQPSSCAGVPTSGRRTVATISARSLLPPSSPSSSAGGRSEVAVRAARGGRFVLIERLLGGAEMLGHVLEVQADARPGGGAPAHGVDQDVGRSEVGGGLGVPRLPALESREGVRLPRGAAGLDQRLLRDPPAGSRRR